MCYKGIAPTCVVLYYRPLSRRLDRCDRVIQNESRDPFGGNVYYVTMQITSLTRNFRNGERNFHCYVVHITTKWVSSLTLDCNGVFAIKAYSVASSLSDRSKCFTLHTLAYLFIPTKIRLPREAFMQLLCEAFIHESPAFYHIMLADMLFADFIL